MVVVVVVVVVVIYSVWKTNSQSKLRTFSKNAKILIGEIFAGNFLFKIASSMRFEDNKIIVIYDLIHSTILHWSELFTKMNSVDISASIVRPWR